MGFLKYFCEKLDGKDCQDCSFSGIRRGVCRDRELGLKWNKITRFNLTKNKSFFDEMAEWSNDEGIRRFISSNMPINELVYSFIDKKHDCDFDDKCNLFFCFNESGDFVGFTYITAPNKFNSSAMIEYLVVNPKYRNCGIGTRMIKSVLTNEKYFNNGFKCEGVMTTIESLNIASYKAFSNNGFDVVSSNWGGDGRNYKVLKFLSKEDVDNENEMSK